MHRSPRSPLSCRQYCVHSPPFQPSRIFQFASQPIPNTSTTRYIVGPHPSILLSIPPSPLHFASLASAPPLASAEKTSPRPLTARVRCAPKPALEWSTGSWGGYYPLPACHLHPLNSTAFRMPPSARSSFLTPHRKARAVRSPTASSLLRLDPLFLRTLVYSVCSSGINKCRCDMRYGHNELLQSKVHFHPAPSRFRFVLVGRCPRPGALFRSWSGPWPSRRLAPKTS